MAAGDRCRGLSAAARSGVRARRSQRILSRSFWREADGFECYHDDAAETIASCPDIDFGRPWAHALGLRIGGDENELRAAFMAATAYARATDGVVWDGESGEVMSPDRAAEVTRDIDRDIGAHAPP
jgi:hypothetical protein